MRSWCFFPGVWRAAFMALALALVGVSGSPVQAQQAAQRIAAIVNQEIISNREVASRINLAIVAAGLADDPQNRQRLAPQVLRGLIDERLQLQDAARLGVSVTDAEIERAYADVARQNNLTPEALGRSIAGRGVDPAVIRDQLRAQIAWIKIIGRELRSRVVVTNEQIDLAIRAAATADEELLLSEIVLPVYRGEDEQQVMAQARDLVSSVKTGVELAALARQVSSAPSAETGGDLGWVRLSAIAPELRAAVATLQPGQISVPTRTASGVSVIAVRDRRAVPASAVSSDPTDRERARRRLQDEQLQRLATRYLRELRRNAFIDVRL